MRRYLTQIGCTLRPGRSPAPIWRCAASPRSWPRPRPRLLAVAAVTRRHIEDYKPWLAARPGQKVPRLTPNTIAHRLGKLRMFFIRIDEWGWEDAPGRVPIVAGDLPRQDHPLPKALDDAAAAKFLRAATGQRRMLVRVVCEVLIRTGLRVSELIGLQADAIVQIGAGHWLHVPVGKLHDDRYLPLHPHLVDLIGDYRTRHVSATILCCCPGKTGNRWTATASPATSTKPPPRPASATSTPTRCGTPWPPRRSTAG